MILYTLHMSSREEALVELLNAEPYRCGSGRELSERKLQLRYLAEHMPESHQKYWKVQVHRWFIENSNMFATRVEQGSKKYHPHITTILDDAVGKMHGWKRGTLRICSENSDRSESSTQELNDLILQVHGELSNFLKSFRNRGDEDRKQVFDGKTIGWMPLDYTVNEVRALLYWMDKHLGMYLNIATVEENQIHEILETADEEAYIRKDWLNREAKRYLIAKTIEENTSICSDVAKLIADFVL